MVNTSVWSSPIPICIVCYTSTNGTYISYLLKGYIVKTDQCNWKEKTNEQLLQYIIDVLPTKAPTSNDVTFFVKSKYNFTRPQIVYSAFLREKVIDKPIPRSASASKPKIRSVRSSSSGIQNMLFDFKVPESNESIYILGVNGITITGREAEITININNQPMYKNNNCKFDNIETSVPGLVRQALGIVYGTATATKTANRIKDVFKSKVYDYLVINSLSKGALITYNALKLVMEDKVFCSTNEGFDKKIYVVTHGALQFIPKIWHIESKEFTLGGAVNIIYSDDVLRSTAQRLLTQNQIGALNKGFMKYTLKNKDVYYINQIEILTKRTLVQSHNYIKLIRDWGIETGKLCVFENIKNQFDKFEATSKHNVFGLNV